MRRRDFLASTLLAALATGCTPPGRPVRVLLRSSWQTVNIGDIAHTPGVLALLERHLPEAELTLWPSDIGNGVKELLQRRFPALRFARRPPSRPQPSPGVISSCTARARP